MLKLEVTLQRGKGRLTGATTIQRINTKGGVAEGPCENSGAFLSVPYSADYTFLTKGGSGLSDRTPTLRSGRSAFTYAFRWTADVLYSRRSFLSLTRYETFSPLRNPLYGGV